MATTVFMVHFKADFSGQQSLSLTNRLGLTVTRVDDWDRLMGFRLVGDSGAIRLFVSPKRDPNDRNTWYNLSGTATQLQDRESLEKLYEECVAAVQSLGGQIDDGRSIRPPGHSIDSSGGATQESK
jgi:hypothetical protein